MGFTIRLTISKNTALHHCVSRAVLQCVQVAKHLVNRASDCAVRDAAHLGVEGGKSRAAETADTCDDKMSDRVALSQEQR